MGEPSALWETFDDAMDWAAKLLVALVDARMEIDKLSEDVVDQQELLKRRSEVLEDIAAGLCGGFNKDARGRLLYPICDCPKCLAMEALKDL